MGRQRKTPKPKQLSYVRIDRSNDPMQVYPVMDELKEKYRPDLEDCRLALAWRQGLKPNKDGQLVLGKCKKVTELDKEYASFDFIIILNREAYAALTEEQRKALIYHELCHAAIATDPNGNPKKDARNRQVYRLRKHDIEEFGEVIAKFGCYMQDLENFVATAMKSKKPPAPTLLDGFDEDKGGKGEAAVAEAEAEPPVHVPRLARERRPVPAKQKGKSGKGKSKAA